MFFYLLGVDNQIYMSFFDIISQHFFYHSTCFFTPSLAHEPTSSTRINIIVPQVNMYYGFWRYMADDYNCRKCCSRGSSVIKTPNHVNVFLRAGTWWVNRSSSVFFYTCSRKVRVFTLFKGCFMEVVSLLPRSLNYFYVYFFFVIFWFYSGLYITLFCKQLPIMFGSDVCI